jgi:aromatic-L-amino-acid decarboxylase
MIVAEPELTILAWRHRELDNCELLTRINARKRVMLTPGIVNGTFVFRVAIVSHRTHRDRIETLLEDVRGAVSELR